VSEPFTRATLASAGISYGSVSVCSSVRPYVTRRRSTETPKRRITQTTPHDSPGTLSFLMPNISAKLKQGHLNECVKCRWGRL